MKLFFVACKPTETLMFLLFLNSGIREPEMADNRVHDLDFTRNVLHAAAIPTEDFGLRENEGKNRQRPFHSNSGEPTGRPYRTGSTDPTKTRGVLPPQSKQQFDNGYDQNSQYLPIV
jgi:hypothetical protein